MRKFNPNAVNMELVTSAAAVLATAVSAILAVDWKLHLAGGLMDITDRRRNFFSYWINRLEFYYDKH